MRGPVVVIVFSQDDMQHYLDAVSELRNGGVAAEVYLGRAGMKAQMKYADRRGAPAVVILGGDELAGAQGLDTGKDGSNDLDCLDQCAGIRVLRDDRFFNPHALIQAASV